MFDDVMGNIFPAMRQALGEVDITYISRGITRTVRGIRTNITQTLVNDMQTGELGTDTKQEIVNFHVPTNAVDGIPSPDMLAIIECDGKRYSIETVGDWSGTAATITAVRSLGYETTVRRRI